jgi:hypothetical protein
LIWSISIPADEKAGASVMSEEEPTSTDPKAVPAGPLICQRLALRLVSCVKLSDSSEFAGAADTPAEDSTTSARTGDAVSKMSISTAPARIDRCRWVNFPSAGFEIELTYLFL